VGYSEHKAVGGRGGRVEWRVGNSERKDNNFAENKNPQVEWKKNNYSLWL
jgi:hypothetical protein